MSQTPRRRLRDHGLQIGRFPAGPLNALTDVAGVAVGHVTLIEGERIRTGATAILPHPGNLFQDKTPAAFDVLNGYGKFAGSTQIDELGEIESPIVLTNTLATGRAIEAVLSYSLAQPGNERVVSLNAVVGETNDSRLNDIRAGRPTIAEIGAALAAAQPGPIVEGAVGAGTGTVAFGLKGGIGTASRRVEIDSTIPASARPKAVPQSPAADGHAQGSAGPTRGPADLTERADDLSDRSSAHAEDSASVLAEGIAPGPGDASISEAETHWTVGVLVQSNYGGTLKIDGAPLPTSEADKDGSIVIIIATDAPLCARNLKRLARRSFAGLARTGSALSNGSGDYALAFSTAEALRRTPDARRVPPAAMVLSNDQVSPLFEAVIEATEEAILNSMLMAEPMQGWNAGSERRSKVKALDISALAKG